MFGNTPNGPFKRGSKDACGEYRGMALDGNTEDYKQYAAESAKVAAFQQTAIEAGMKSDSIAGVIKTAAAAAKSAQESIHDRAEQQSKQRFDDMMLLALYENGGLDTFIAENVFGGMNDTEIMDVLSMIEAETGKSFEDYAREILGEQMPDRMPGESDADYNRRVLILVADEILEDDLSIKPGYENDPLARFLQDQEITKEARAVVSAHNANAKTLGVEAVAGAAEDDAKESFVTASIMSAESDVEEISAIGSESQDDHREATANEADADAASNSFFVGFPGSGGALEAASVDFSSQFGAASPDTVEVAKVETSLDLTLKS
ncbi:MAG: hypothetical protein AAFR02_10585 [Pseudomonadota bacterium]